MNVSLFCFYFPLIKASFWAKIGLVGLYILLERALATISSRGPYQWRAKIRRAGYPEQSKTFVTKVEAEAWARDIESKIDQGIFIDRSALEKTRLLDILDRYEKEITPTKKGKVQEKSKLKILKNSKLSGMFLAAIQPKDIVSYRNERSKEVAAATVGREINLLSHVFNIARTEWGLPGLLNHAQGIRRLKLPQGRNRRASIDELQRIIAATESPILKVLIPFAIETAMRRGEMVSFEWEDAEFLTGLRLHDMRHEATSRLVEDKNLQMPEVMAVTGHKDIRSMMCSSRDLIGHLPGLTGRGCQIRFNCSIK
jgi:integrase